MEGIATTGVGMAAIATVYILKTVFEFVEKMNARKVERTEGARGFGLKDRKLLEELARLHNQFDQDGVPVWYVRRSLEDSVVKLSKAIEHLVRSQDKQMETMRAYLDEFRRGRRAQTEDGV